jgi:hypothetical protein
MFWEDPDFPLRPDRVVSMIGECRAFSMAFEEDVNFGQTRRGDSLGSTALAE